MMTKKESNSSIQTPQFASNSDRVVMLVNVKPDTSSCVQCLQTIECKLDATLASALSSVSPPLNLAGKCLLARDTMVVLNDVYFAQLIKKQCVIHTWICDASDVRKIVVYLGELGTTEPAMSILVYKGANINCICWYFF